MFSLCLEPHALKRTMTPDHWRRLRDLFHEVQAATPADRAARLAAEPDPKLRREAERMLAADGGSFLEDPAVPAFDGPGEPDGGAVGERVGPWEIVRRAGQGGMGEVFLAERADGAYRQRAALKLVRRGMDSDAVLARFRQERQILAGLDHPGVARLLDGGVAEGGRFDGRPYLAMEYVEGEPITRYCDARRLPVEDRLRLFAEIAEAVGAAHRRLVVHRDLKPSNVLVAEGEDGAPRVKLLDFGIAKLLEPGGDAGGDGASAEPLTRTGVRVLTPAYAAPEQVRGEPVTTATDVYGLGAVLYELLAGRRPVETAGRSGREVERAVLETEPERPSTVVTRAEGDPTDQGSATAPAAVAAARRTEPGRLRKALAGDLDAVCLKALRKEPEARYAGADAFVEDVKRYLEGLPVAAHRGSRAYRARKFVGRHRGALATAALVLALLGAFGVIYTLGVTEERDRAAAEAERAQAEAAKAEQVVTLLTDVFAAANSLGEEGPDVPVGQLLSAGVDEARTALAAQPDPLAALLSAIGSVERSWGRYDEAVALLEEARRLSVGAEVGEETRLGVLSGLAAVYVEAGRLDEAEPLQREVLALAERLHGPESLSVATAASNYGRTLEWQGRLADAESLYRRGIAIRRAVGDRSTDFGANLSYLGGLLSERDRYDEALPLQQEALALVEATVGADHPYAAFALNDLSISQVELGEQEAALASLDRALTISRDHLGSDHPFTATMLYNRASVLRDLGRSDEALAAYAEALAARRRALPEGHQEIGISLTGLGNLLRKLGRPAEAEALLQDALAIREAGLPAPHWATAVAQGNLGLALLAQRRFGEAEAHLKASHRTLQALSDSEPDRLHEARRHLVELYEAWGRPEEAARYRATAGAAP